MITKSKKAVRTTLYLPYGNPTDRQRTDLILSQLNRHLNKAQWRMTVRGRGSRKKHGNSSDLPTRYAEFLAVYLRPLGTEREWREIEHNYFEKLHAEREQVIELRRSLEIARVDKSKVAEQFAAALHQLKLTEMLQQAESTMNVALTRQLEAQQEKEPTWSTWWHDLNTLLWKVVRP